MCLVSLGIRLLCPCPVLRDSVILSEPVFVCMTTFGDDFTSLVEAFGLVSSEYTHLLRGAKATSLRCGVVGAGLVLDSPGQVILFVVVFLFPEVFGELRVSAVLFVAEGHRVVVVSCFERCLC